jgi:hypothetical protein
MSSKPSNVKKNVAASRALGQKMDRSATKVVTSLRQAARARRTSRRATT